MAGRRLHSACSVGLSAPRMGGRVTWAGTLGGRWPGSLRLAASGSLWSARLPLLPSLCLSLSRPQVPPSLPASPRPPRLRPAVHRPFPSLPRTLAVPASSLSLLPRGPTEANSRAAPGLPRPQRLFPHLFQQLGAGTTSRPPAAVAGIGGGGAGGGGGMGVKVFLKYNSHTVKPTLFRAQFCQF